MLSTFQGTAISQSARHIDFGCARFVRQSTRLKDKVFNSEAICILISAWILHLSFNGKTEHVVQILTRGNKDDVFITQSDVGLRVAKDGSCVETFCFQRTIGLTAMNQSACRNSFFRKPTCSSYQLAKCGNVSIHLVFAGAHHCSTQFHHVLVTVKHRVDRHRVCISQLESATLKLVEGVDTHFTTFLTDESYILFISISCESTGKFNQSGHTFVAPHLVEHRSFHLTRNIYQAFVGFYDDDIIRG